MIRPQLAECDFGDLIGRAHEMIDKLGQKSFFKFRPCGGWQPAVNVYETDDDYYICLDLAGVDPKQIDLQVSGNQLQISGHRTPPSPKGMTAPRIHLMEIDHGMFCRSVQIPSNVTVDKIEARHSNGLIWIQLPKIP